MKIILISNNLFLKFFILFNLIIFILFSLFLYDFFLIWLILEINTFLFTCYLILLINNKKLIFLYFLIQVISSLILIFPLLIMNLNLINFNNFFFINYYISLMLKLGIPPFHIWMLLLSSYLPWYSLFILLTLQKIIPFYIFSLLNSNLFILYLLIILSSLIPILKMINLMNLKILLTYSSINQTSWMLIMLYFKNLFWMIYLIFYSLILFFITIFMHMYKISMNFHINTLSTLNFNLICLFLMLNLASLPPFSFFFIKWFSIFILILNSSKLFFIFILMLISSFILIYVYINMMILFMFFFIIQSKLFKFNNLNFFKSLNYSLFLFINFFLSMTMILL